MKTFVFILSVSLSLWSQTSFGMGIPLPTPAPAPNPSPAPAPSPSPAPTPAPAPPPPPPEIDATPKTSAQVLYIGDSHSVGGFGATLDNSLRALYDSQTGAHLRVNSVATCGSSSAGWLKASHKTTCGYRACDATNTCTNATSGTSVGLSALLISAGPRPWPETTIVALGSNMLKDPPPFNATMNDVAKLINQIKSAQSLCIWIGPPRAGTNVISEANYAQFVTRMKATVQNNGCHFIDSATKTAMKDLSKDGLHYPTAAGKAWGQKVLAEIESILNSP